MPGPGARGPMGGHGRHGQMAGGRRSKNPKKTLARLLGYIKATPQNTPKEKPCGKIPSGRAYIRHSISDAGALI